MTSSSVKPKLPGASLRQVLLSRDVTVPFNLLGASDMLGPLGHLQVTREVSAHSIQGGEYYIEVFTRSGRSQLMWNTGSIRGT